MINVWMSGDRTEMFQLVIKHGLYVPNVWVYEPKQLKVIQHLQPLESQWKWDTSALTYHVFYYKIVLEWASTDVPGVAGKKLEGQ